MSPVAVAAVVFDLDDTLFDHSRSARRGLETWLRLLDVVPTPALTAAWFDAEDRQHTAWLNGTVSHVEHRRGRLREFLPLVGRPVGDPADLDEVFGAYLGGYRAAWVGYDDVAAALDDVHRLGVATAVLTNGTTAQQTAKLSALGLLDVVGPVFTAEDLGVAKPRPEAFARVCTALGLPPEQVLYVGDNHVVDVLGARAAGLQAVHLDRTGHGPTTEPWRITTLADLAPLLGPTSTANPEPTPTATASADRSGGPGSR